MRARREFVNTDPELVAGVAAASASLLLLTVLTFALPVFYPLPHPEWLYVALILPLLVMNNHARLSFLVTLAATVGLFLLYAPLAVAGVVLTAYTSLRSVGDAHNVQARRMNPLLRTLARELPEWQVITPRHEQARQTSRVLVSPSGQFFFLAFAQGQERQEQGVPTITWNGATAQTVRNLSAREGPQVTGAQHVVWVSLPPEATAFVPDHAWGVVSVYGPPSTLARQLWDWELDATFAGEEAAGPQATSGPAQTVPSGAATVPRPEVPNVQEVLERELTAESLQALLPALQGSWTLSSPLLLPDASTLSALLLAPGGERFVLNVRLRRDRMTLAAATSGQETFWQREHARLLSAAQSHRATAVLWQPLANAEATASVSGVWVVRGDAALLAALLQVLAPVKPPEPRFDSPDPFEVLGLFPQASPEEIKSAYRDLAKRHHPDRAGQRGEAARAQAQVRMQAINAAYAEALTRVRG